MKKGILFFGLMFCIVSFSFAQADFSGTFVNSNGRLGLMFVENTVLIHGDGNPMVPPLNISVSGNSISSRTLQGEPRPENTFNWTIIDINTIRDGDGDVYTRVTSLSGTFSYSRSYTITFSGSNFSLQWGSNNFTGTYSISDSYLILNRQDSVTWRWRIVSRDVLRDHDGDTWRK